MTLHESSAIQRQAKHRHEKLNRIELNRIPSLSLYRCTMRYRALPTQCKHVGEERGDCTVSATIYTHEHYLEKQEKYIFI